MAAETSTKQMALTRDVAPGGFIERVQALTAQVATTVLTEPATRAFHAARAAYAHNVLAMPSLAATQVAPQVVMLPQVINQTTYDETTKIAVNSTPDTALQAAISTAWNSLAGIDTPS